MAVSFVGVRVLQRKVWERAVAGGYWLQITPPRVTDPARAVLVWRLLGGLVGRAGAGRRLVTVPLAFEVGRDPVSGRAVAGVWLPRWVPESTARAELARAWPGAIIDRAAGPDWGTPPAPIAGRRLRAMVSDHGPLTDEATSAGHGLGAGGSDGDLLRPVFVSLADAEQPVWVQVLVRPVPSRRMAALRQAVRRPTKGRRSVLSRVTGGLGIVLGEAVKTIVSLLPGNSGPTSAPRHAGSVPPDPLQRLAMREAAGKLAAGPHYLAVVRVGAVGHGGHGVAGAVADGFVTISHVLSPVRMWRARAWLSPRRAKPGDWLLVTAAELAALARFPADPARYGFATASHHRPAGGEAFRATDESHPTDGAQSQDTDSTQPIPELPAVRPEYEEEEYP